jgi:hypothetical protein
MYRWTAKCWLGSKSGFVDIEVNASSFAGAKEQLVSIYGAEQVRNLRKIGNSSGGSSIPIPSSAGGVIIGLFVISTAFLYFTPWFLMTLYGGGATWAAEKLTGQSVAEYGDTSDEHTTDNEHKKAAIVFGSALLFGMIGFIHGTIWNVDLNKQYNLDGKQPKVEEVRKLNQ